MRLEKKMRPRIAGTVLEHSDEVPRYNADFSDPNKISLFKKHWYFYKQILEKLGGEPEYDEGLGNEDGIIGSLPINGEQQALFSDSSITSLKRVWVDLYSNDALIFFENLIQGSSVFFSSVLSSNKKTESRPTVQLKKSRLDWNNQVLQVRLEFSFPEQTSCLVAAWKISSYEDQMKFFNHFMWLVRYYPEAGELLLTEERLWPWMLDVPRVLDVLFCSPSQPIKVEQLLLASWVLGDWPRINRDQYSRFVQVFHAQLSDIQTCLIDVIQRVKHDLISNDFKKYFVNNIMCSEDRKPFLSCLCDKLEVILQNLDLPLQKTAKLDPLEHVPVFWQSEPHDERGERERSFHNSFFWERTTVDGASISEQKIVKIVPVHHLNGFRAFEERLRDQFKDPFETWLALAEKNDPAFPVPRLLDFKVLTLGSGIRINWTTQGLNYPESSNVFLSSQQDALDQVDRIVSLRLKLGLTEMHELLLFAAKEALELRYNPLEDDVMETVEKLEEKLAVLEAQELAGKETYEKERLAKEPIVLSKASSILILCLSVVFGLGYLSMKLYGRIKNRPVRLSDSACFWRSNKKDALDSEGGRSSKVDSSQFQNNEFGQAQSSGQIRAGDPFADSDNQGMDAAIRMG